MASLKSNSILYQTATGTVYKTLDVESGNMHALEVIDVHVYNSYGQAISTQAVDNAIALSKRIASDFEPTHRHVMLYTGKSSSDSPHNSIKNEVVNKKSPELFQISCEYISGNSLQNLISSLNGQVISIYVVQSYTWQLLQGIHQLHREGRCHGSLCADNVRFDRLGNLKLTSWWMMDISRCCYQSVHLADINRQPLVDSIVRNVKGNDEEATSYTSYPYNKQLDSSAIMRMCGNLKLMKDLVCCLRGSSILGVDGIDGHFFSNPLFYIHYDAVCLGLILLDLTITSGKARKIEDKTMGFDLKSSYERSNGVASFDPSSASSSDKSISTFKRDIRAMLEKNPPPTLSELILKKIIASHVPVCYRGGDAHDFIEQCFISPVCQGESSNNTRLSQFQHHPFLQKVRETVDCQFIDAVTKRSNLSNISGGDSGDGVRTAQAAHHGIKISSHQSYADSPSNTRSSIETLTSPSFSSSHRSADRTPAQKQFLKRLGGGKKK